MKNYQSDQPCVVCGLNQSLMVCYHHIKTRKAYPELKDEKFNLISLCVWHHSEVHQIGMVSFSKKYSSVNDWLISNGWELSRGKWNHF